MGRRRERSLSDKEKYERISSVIIEFINGEGERDLTQIGTNRGWDSLEEAGREFKEEERRGCREILSVKEAEINGGNPDAFDVLASLIRDKRPDVTQEELEDFRFWVMPYPSSKYSRDNAIVVPFDRAAAYLKQADSNDNMDLVMFRPFNCVLFNVRNHMSHEVFCSAWYRIFKYVIFGKDTLENAIMERESFKRGEEAENFLHEGYGFFQTGAMQTYQIIASSEHPLTFAEKQVFKGIRVRYMEKD